MRPFSSISSLALALGVTAASLLGSVQAPTSSPSSASGLSLAAAPVAHAQSSTFAETFTGRPSGPTPYRPTGWDVAVHSRDISTWQQPESMQGGHGADCAAHPATHMVSEYQDTVFQCNDHLMTAINASGYGAIYLAPNQLVDFGSGEATIRFDMSTLRTSTRDWIDVWVTPFEDNVPAPLDEWLPDLSGPPRRAIHVRMDTFNGTSVFKGSVFRNFGESGLDSNWWTGFETFLTPSAIRRDTFELKISKTGLKFGMPGYNNFRWVDQQFPALDWTRGVVQFGHHSYTPMKDCAGPCAPNTWHWDNVQISPAVPFTIISGNRGLVTASSPTVTFAGPAPADSYLRLLGIGENLQASYDGGPWETLPRRQMSKSPDEVFKPYWSPVPAGTRQVTFRGSDWWGNPWAVNSAAIWSLNTEGGSSGPAPTATSTSTAAPATATATATTSSATATATAPGATATATSPAATATVTSTPLPATATPTQPAAPATATLTPPAATATVTPTAPAASPTSTPAPPTAGGGNGSLRLNGSARAVVPHTPELNLTGDWTIELWFKDEYSTSGAGTFNHAPQTLLIAGETNSDADIPVHIWLEWGGLNAGDRRGWDHQVASYYLQGHNVPANAWHHLAVTKSAATRRVQIVLDGRLIVDTVVGGQNPSQAGRPLTIGRNGNHSNWRGKLDDVRIWNVVRSVSEIAASFRSELISAPPGLVANWKFNETTGTTAVDSAGSPQNATLRNGGAWTTDVHP